MINEQRTVISCFCKSIQQLIIEHNVTEYMIHKYVTFSDVECLSSRMGAHFFFTYWHTSAYKLWHYYTERNWSMNSDEMLLCVFVLWQFKIEHFVKLNTWYRIIYFLDVECLSSRDREAINFFTYWHFRISILVKIFKKEFLSNKAPFCWHGLNYAEYIKS